MRFNESSITEAQYEAAEREMFEEEVANDACVMAWRDGHLSDKELLDRLKYLRAYAWENAGTRLVDRLAREYEDSFERRERE